MKVHFLLFLNLKLQLVQKFEVKETFRGFRVFDFGHRAKSKTRKLWKFSSFSPCYFLVLISVNFLLLLKLESQLRAERTYKEEHKVDHGYVKFI